MSKKIKDDIVLSVSHVSKDFHLPHHKSDSIKSAIVNLFKRKDKGIDIQHALKDISVDIKKGEFFGIVGRNGSGKSTLLKIIAGIYRPTKGTVMTKGKLVPFIELGVGFNPELTGRENVYLNGALLGFSRSEIDAQYDDIVAFAELQDYMDLKLKNYSSGMQVRLAFSVAVRAEANILLVDEVLAVGDADFQRKCYEYFKKLKKDKKTVVFVSHDMIAIREYCDRAVLIDESKIVKQGLAGNVASAYAKLFMTDNSEPESETLTDTGTGQSSIKRWGNKDMILEKVSFDKNKYCPTDKYVQIETKYKVMKNTTNPIFGISVKNSSGVVIMGTNTIIQHIETGEFRKNDAGSIGWKIPNIFNDGYYTIDAAIIHENSITQYDWWEEARGFTVFREEHTPYVVEPEIIISMGSI